MSNGRRSKCGHFLLGLAVKQSSKAGGRAGGRAQDLGSLDLVDVLGRADQDFGNTGRLRQDTIRHRHTLAGEWRSMGWAGRLACWLAVLLRGWKGEREDGLGLEETGRGLLQGRQESTRVDRSEPSPGDARATSRTNAHWPGTWSGTSLLTFPRPVALLADDCSLPIRRLS